MAEAHNSERDRVSTRHAQKMDSYWLGT